MLDFLQLAGELPFEFKRVLLSSSISEFYLKNNIEIIIVFLEPPRTFWELYISILTDLKIFLYDYSVSHFYKNDLSKISKLWKTLIHDKCYFIAFGRIHYNSEFLVICYILIYVATSGGTFIWHWCHVSNNERVVCFPRINYSKKVFFFASLLRSQKNRRRRIIFSFPMQTATQSNSECQWNLQGFGCFFLLLFKFIMSTFLVKPHTHTYT